MQHLQQRPPTDIDGLLNLLVVAFFLLWPLIGLLRAFLAKLLGKRVGTPTQTQGRGGAAPAGTASESGSAREEVERALERLLRGELPEDEDEEAQPAARRASSAPPPLPSHAHAAGTLARAPRPESESHASSSTRPLGELSDAFEPMQPAREPLAPAPSEDEVERTGAHSTASLEGRSYDSMAAGEQHAHAHARQTAPSGLPSFQSALPAFDDAHAAADISARAQRADPQNTHAPRHALRIALSRPGSVRRAIVLAELLGPPLALRPPALEAQRN